MKLIFPNSDDRAVVLTDGPISVGSAPDRDVVLGGGGMAQHHALLREVNGQWEVAVDDPQKFVSVNGDRVVDATPFSIGDRLSFAAVMARAVDVEVAKKRPVPVASDNNVDDGRTVVRMALPRFLLRGVSGGTFGKNFPLHGTTIIGRHKECDIVLDSNEISRRHAKVQVTVEGITVEDMGSANGTFINGKRIHDGVLGAGDELSLDTIRFLLQAPGLPQESAGKTAVDSQVAGAGEKKQRKGLLFVIAGVVLALIVAAAGYFLGFDLGQVLPFQN